jgi:hypothetical protein
LTERNASERDACHLGVWFSPSESYVGACTNGAHVFDQIRAIDAINPSEMCSPGANCGSSIWPISTPPQLERVGHDGNHPVTVA